MSDKPISQEEARELLEAMADLVETFNPDLQAFYEFARPKIERARKAIAKATC